MVLTIFWREMETDIKKLVGQRLQIIRLENNLTQEQMGEKLSLSTSAYCKIEYGETDLTLTRLSKIAEILNIPVVELFGKIMAYADAPCGGCGNTAGKNKEVYPMAIDNNETLRELIKANTRIIDLLCKRIDMLEQKLG